MWGRFLKGGDASQLMPNANFGTALQDAKKQNVRNQNTTTQQGLRASQKVQAKNTGLLSARPVTLQTPLQRVLAAQKGQNTRTLAENTRATNVQAKNVQAKTRNVQAKNVQTKSVQAKNVQTKNMQAKNVQTYNQLAAADRINGNAKNTGILRARPLNVLNVKVQRQTGPSSRTDRDAAQNSTSMQHGGW